MIFIFIYLLIYLIFIFNFEQSLQEDSRFSRGCVLNKLWTTPWTKEKHINYAHCMAFNIGESVSLVSLSRGVTS